MIAFNFNIAILQKDLLFIYINTVVCYKTIKFSLSLKASRILPFFLQEKRLKTLNIKNVTINIKKFTLQAQNLTAI